MNKSYSGVRDCIYQYHRKGLDMMTENNETARGSITTGMESLQKVYKEKPSLFIFQVFFAAKGDELVNIYSQGSPMEKTRIVNILNVVDPANSNKYKKILNP
jgi:hypothetical protein